jgi:hypothetical protein
MAEKKVDIVLEALFRDRDNAFAKAKRSSLELVREQRTAQQELVSQQRTALAEAEQAERDSLEQRLKNSQAYFARRIQLVRSSLYAENNKEAELFREVEKARTAPMEREESRLLKNRAKHQEHLEKRVAAERDAAAQIQKIRQEALFRESDQFLETRSRADGAASSLAARRASERQIRESTGGGGSSRFRLQQEADKINASIRGEEFGGLLGAAGQLSKLIKYVVYIRAGIEGVRLASRLWKGDLEGVAQAIQELPFGIGSAARELVEVMSELSGYAADIEKQTKAIAELEKRGERIQAQTAASDQLNALLKQLRVENADPFEQEIARAQQARDEALAEVERIRKEGGDQSGERTKEARDRIQQEFRQQEEDIRHRQAVAKDAEEGAIYEAKALREKEARDRETELRDQGRREAAIESEIRQMQLRAMGQDMDAQLEAIRSAYAERIAAAQTDRERLLLEQQQSLEEDAARGGSPQQRGGKGGRANSGVAALQLSERFLGLGVGTASRESKAELATVETAKTSKDLLAATKQVVKALERLGTGGSQPQIVSL